MISFFCEEQLSTLPNLSISLKSEFLGNAFDLWCEYENCIILQHRGKKQYLFLGWKMASLCSPGWSGTLQLITDINSEFSFLCYLILALQCIPSHQLKIIEKEGEPSALVVEHRLPPPPRRYMTTLSLHITHLFRAKHKTELHLRGDWHLWRHVLAAPVSVTTVPATEPVMHTVHGRHKVL